MEMKKKIIIGLAVLLIAISCGKKEEKNADKNNPEKTVTEASKDSGNISENEIKKYTEYVSLKNVPNEEEWQDSFKEVFTREFSDEKGEFKKPSAKGIESIIKTEETVNIFSEYVKDLEENIKKEPKFDEVDKSAEGLVQSLNNEKNVITEIVDYYKNKKYEKDNFEEGKKLAEKYKNATEERKNSYNAYSAALDKLSEKIGDKIVKKAETDGKTAMASLVKYVNEANNFVNTAFAKENLKFDKEEVKKLKELHLKMQESYLKLKETTDEAAAKEGINAEEFKEIKKNSEELLENADKMIKAAENNAQKDVAIYASKFLNAHSKTVDGYNIISAKK
jgi:hypothetical protein